MKVLITGGAGYIGSHCCRYFAEQGIAIVVLDDLRNGSLNAVLSGRFVEGDYGDKDLINNLLATEQFDGIIHFAASHNLLESISKPELYYKNNVLNMKTLLDAAVEHRVNNFVFSSSSTVYGNVEKLPIEENDLLNPVNPYGTTKMIGELMLADYHKAYGLSYCAFRYFNAAGASSDGLLGEIDPYGTRLVTNTLKAAINKETMCVFGNDYPTRDGTCLKDYIHVEDLAEAHYLGLQFLMNDGESGCFNLGSATGVTVLEMIHAAEEVVGEKISYSFAERRAGDVPNLIASIEKAKNLLGWIPKKSDVKTIFEDAYRWEMNKRY